MGEGRGGGRKIQLVQLLTFISIRNFQRPAYLQVWMCTRIRVVFLHTTASALRTPSTAPTAPEHTATNSKVPKCPSLTRVARCGAFARTSDWAGSSFVK